MDFGTQTNKGRRKIKLVNGRDINSYPHNLQLYSVPPLENISLQDFEDLAIERLKVLQALETLGIRHVRGSPAYEDAFPGEIRKVEGPKWATLKKDHETTTLERYEARRKDHISHFILRLAYCRTEDLRRWFLQQELDLFRFRFSREDDDSISTFLKLNNLDYSPIPEKERDALASKLANCSHNMSEVKVRATSYYKVPFTEALELVRGRKCFLKNGFAYVPYSDLVVIILSVFRTHLSHALTVTSRVLPQLEEDERLLPMLKGLSNRYLGEDYTHKKPTAGQITADMIDTLAKKSFPLCMQQLHQGVKQQHHLKHWGRMQYGLFLKGIGLSLEEALKFWRKEFTKSMDTDKFDKSYAYNIRHNYGKEGKRADYTPYSCLKVIMSNPPGPGDSHGCPFRHSDLDMLRQRMQSLRIPKDATDEIVSLVRGSHYQVACGKYFEIVHKTEEGYAFTPNHPNQYFEESRNLLDEGKNLDGTPKNSSQVSRTPRSVTVVKKKAQPEMKPKDDFEDEPLSAEDMASIFDGIEPQ